MRILICLNPFVSHFIPIIPVVEGILRRKGEVVFIGFPQLKEEVEKCGYEYVTIEKSTDERIQKVKREHNYDELEYIFKSIHAELKEKITEINPDLALFHISRFDIYYIPIHDMKIKYMTYDMSFGKVKFSAFLPPSTSSVIPIGMLDMRSTFAWLKRMKRKNKDLKWSKLKTKYPYAELETIRKENNMKWRFCIDGYYLESPHIKFSPGRMEYRKEKNVLYAGLCVNSQNEYNTPIVFERNKRTMSNRYLKGRDFIRCLVEVIGKHSEFDMVISLGKKGEVFPIDKIPSNIKIYDYVNQIDILKKVDLVITHGGAGTIKECICHEVPMLIVPSSYDQMGNASKVHYHRIGLKNYSMRKTFFEQHLNKSIKKINVVHLEKQILEVLNDQRFKDRISEFHKKIEEDNEKIHFIDSILCI